jgi:glycosyltransferase involved in cell wall biosynthesis
VTPDPSLRGSDLGDRSNLETALQSTLAVTPDPSLRGSAPGDRSNLTLVHVGKVYDGTALPFLQAQGALGEAGARLQVRFIGGLAPQEQAWLKTHPLAVQVQVEPRLAHAEAIQAMQAADVLLLFVLGRDSRSGHYPGKLFEYLASGRPVLLVGPQGDAADLLRRSGTGCAVDAAQANAIVEILKSLVEKPAAFLNQYYRPRSEVIAAYERQALTARLAAVFDSLTQPLSA